MSRSRDQCRWLHCTRSCSACESEMQSGAMSKYLRVLEKVAASPPVTPLPGPEGACPDGVKPHLVALVTPTAFEAEPYRVLGRLVVQMSKEAGLRVLAISSPSAGDGK